MRRICGFMLLVMAVVARPVHADITADSVETSIRRGIEFLKRQQNAKGGWDEYGDHNGGLSALCTLAMSTAGVPYDDPTLARAMVYLRRLEPDDTYSVSLQTLVYCQVGANEDLPRIQRNVKLLEDLQWGAEPSQPLAIAGAWPYGVQRRTSGDPSNTQFALLALAAAEERGVSVSSATFEIALEYWNKLQSDSGGWPYAYGNDWPATGSMTCAGIASIIICRGKLAAGSSRIVGDEIQCCGASENDNKIERGLAWLGNGFSVRRNPGPNSTNGNLFYYLYALERVGRLSGRRMIGGHDWYREGAEFLVSIQDPIRGFWAGNSPENNRNIATSFALLFLAKGKRQVVIGQLDYSSTDETTRVQKHPESTRQLVRHIERDWGRDLTWQTIKLKGSTVGDLLQAPVLLIAGNEPLQFTEDEKARLKEYVENGGFLFFEATAGSGCGSPQPFEQSVKQLCSQLFENPLERLPPTHPIWFAERRADPVVLGDDFWVYGIQECCRTAAVYVPAALTCRWELSDPAGRAKHAEPVAKQLAAAVALGQNIVAYATGRDLQDKLDLPSVMEGETIERAGHRGVLTVPRLILGAGGEEARRAIPNLARYVQRDTPIRITTDSPLVEISEESLEPFVVAWVHGRREFALTDQQVQALRSFLKGGGTLLVDSICGNDEFAKSFRSQMARVLPDSPLKPLPVDHPLLTDAYGGYDVTNVTLLSPTRGGSGAITVQRKNTPAVIESAVVDGRIVVVFSPYDLSCALESQSSLQCPGYSTEDAAKIGINMLMFLLLQ